MLAATVYLHACISSRLGKQRDKEEWEGQRDAAPEVMSAAFRYYREVPTYYAKARRLFSCIAVAPQIMSKNGRVRVSPF